MRQALMKVPVFQYVVSSLSPKNLLPMSKEARMLKAVTVLITVAELKFISISL